jgi:hypothetical protein
MAASLAGGPTPEQMVATGACSMSMARCTSGTYRSVRVCCRTRCLGSTALRPLAISSSSHGNSRAVAFLEIIDVDGDG